MTNSTMDILLIDGLHRSRHIDAANNGPNFGKLIAIGQHYDLENSLRRDCDTLGWIFESISAPKTNFNDLYENSPLRKTVHFAGQSDKPWLFMISGVNERFLNDDHSKRALEYISRFAAVVIPTDVSDAHIDGWLTLDFSLSGKPG